MEGFANVPISGMPNRLYQFLILLNAIGFKIRLFFIFIKIQALQITGLKGAHAFFGKGQTNQPVKDDNISILFTIITAAELVFGTLFLNSTLEESTVLATIIFVVGIVMQFTFLKFDPSAYPDDSKKRVQILTWTIFDLVIFYGVNLTVSKIPQSIEPTMFSSVPFTAQQEFLILIAVAEERFFRGFILNAFVKYAKNTGIAIAGEAFLFAIYHSYVYGGELNSFIIVLTAGIIISTGDIRTGRISTGMLSHILNNVA